MPLRSATRTELPAPRDCPLGCASASEAHSSFTVTQHLPWARIWGQTGVSTGPGLRCFGTSRNKHSGRGLTPAATMASAEAKGAVPGPQGHHSSGVWPQRKAQSM